MDNLPKKQNFSCVYRIVSKTTGDCYVGSAKNLGVRRRNHLCQLRQKRHHSPNLQAHVDKYGLQDLVFAVLLITPYVKAEIREKEQRFMDLYNPQLNHKKTATGVGHKASPETIKKLRESHLGNKPTQETLDKQRNAMKAVHATMTPERKLEWVKGMRGINNRKIICNETGIIYESIAAAERETGCDNIGLIAQGKRAQSRGFTFKYYQNEL